MFVDGAFEDVASLDASTAVAVGWAGTIVKTTDGGGTWQSHSFPTSNDLQSVCFVDANVGYAVGGDYGTSSIVLKTTDGGVTWRALSTGVRHSLESVFFTDANTGWIVGRDGVIVATTDAGATWKTQHQDANHWFAGVHFVSSTTGWAVGDTILKTTNGGTTWNPQPNPTPYSMNDVVFIDSQRGWAVGGDMTFGWYTGQSAILRTSDGGTSWSAYYPSLKDYLLGVDFINPTTGWAVGGEGTILKTTDGGISWSTEQSNVSSIVMAVDFVTATDGWAVGINGIQRCVPPMTVARLSGTDRYGTSVKTSQSEFPTTASVVVIATGENWPDALGAGVLAAKAGGPLLITRKASIPASVSAEVDRLSPSKAYIIGSESAVSGSVEDVLKAKGITVVRLGGVDRYETAALVADEVASVEGTPSGYFLVSGENFPDALSAAPVAARLGYPILLTRRASLPAQTSARVPSDATVVIAGSDAAVASAVYTRFPNRTRLYGKDRYLTCKAIADWALDQHPESFSPTNIGVATGANYPDALGGGPFMQKKGGVLLLVPKAANDAFTAFVRARRLSMTDATVFGSSAAVGDSVVKYLRGF